MALTKFDVRFTRAAHDDIIEIMDYISVELCDPSAAQSLYVKIVATLETVSCFPSAMPVLRGYDYFNKHEYHRVDIGNYVAIYSIDDAAHVLYVDAVKYAKSNVLENLLNKLTGK